MGERLADTRLTKGLSSLGGRDGRPCFGCLPFGRVNTDPGWRGRAARGPRLKGTERLGRHLHTHNVKRGVREEQEVMKPSFQREGKIKYDKAMTLELKNHRT